MIDPYGFCLFTYLINERNVCVVWLRDELTLAGHSINPLRSSVGASIADVMGLNPVERT